MSTVSLIRVKSSIYLADTVFPLVRINTLLFSKGLKRQLTSLINFDRYTGRATRHLANNCHIGETACLIIPVNRICKIGFCDAISLVNIPKLLMRFFIWEAGASLYQRTHFQPCTNRKHLQTTNSMSLEEQNYLLWGISMLILVDPYLKYLKRLGQRA